MRGSALGLQSAALIWRSEVPRLDGPNTEYGEMTMKIWTKPTLEMLEIRSAEHNNFADMDAMGAQKNKQNAS